MQSTDTMGPVGQVMGLLETAEGQGQFLEWAGHPTTQLMLLAARKLAVPGAPYDGPGGTADFLLGKARGANEILDFLEMPRGSIADMQDKRQRLAPTYGAATILKKERAGG